MACPFMVNFKNNLTSDNSVGTFAQSSRQEDQTGLVDTQSRQSYTLLFRNAFHSHFIILFDGPSNSDDVESKIS